MSQSKAYITVRAQQLEQQNADLTWKLMQLLSYVHERQDDYPDMHWPDLPFELTEADWRAIA